MANTIINAFHGGEAFWRYAYELDAAYHRGLGSWLPDPDFALSRDPEIWQKVRRDPVIDQGVAQRRHAVGGRPRHAVPPDGFEGDKYDLAASITTGALRKIKNRAEAFLLLSDAVFLGRTFSFIEGRRVRCELAPGTGIREWWVPTLLRDIDRLRVRIESRYVGEKVAAGKTLETRYDSRTSSWMPEPRQMPKIGTVATIYDINTRQWVEITNLERLVSVMYDNAEHRLGYGRGILESIFYYHYAKGTLFREGLNGAERFGQGTLVYEYNREAWGSADQPNTAVASEALDVLAKLTARNQAAIPSGDKILRLDPSAEGHQIVMDLLRYCDEGLTRRLTGSLLPSGAGSDLGSLARSEVEQDTTNTVVEYDQGLLDNALTHSIVPTFFRMNRAQLRSLGIDERHMPEIKAKVEQVIDPERFSKVIAPVWTANPSFPVRRDEVYRQLGLSEPKDGEETIDAMEGKLAMAAAGADRMGNQGATE